MLGSINNLGRFVSLVVWAALLTPAGYGQESDDLTKYPPQFVTENQLSFEVETLKHRLAEIEFIEANMKSQLAKYEEQSEILRAEQTSLAERMVDAVNLSHLSFEPTRISLEQQLTELEISLVGMEAQRKAIFEFTQDSSRNINAAEMEVVKKQLEVAQQLLDNEIKKRDTVKALHDRGSAPDSEVLNAENSVLEAQLRVTEIKAAMEMKQKMNPEIQARLLDVSLEIATAKAKVDYIRNKLRKMGDISDVVEKIELIQSLRLPALYDQITRVNAGLSQDTEKMRITRRIAEIQKYLNSIEKSPDKKSELGNKDDNSS